ncbi:MAG: hypothetical protein NUV63_12380 [Gallionella sp.]|nr:hypothetical protein [Gallionella sp.]
MKPVLRYSVVKENDIAPNTSNEGVLYDRTVTLQSSRGTWRLIGFRSPEGIDYEYLTNDQELLPGVVAFLYHRRWDKEKYYDCFKNNNKQAKITLFAANIGASVQMREMIVLWVRYRTDWR